MPRRDEGEDIDARRRAGTHEMQMRIGKAEARIMRTLTLWK
jgi:hypothetical protein